MSEPTKPTDSPSWDTALTNTGAPDAGHVAAGWATDEIPSSAVVNWLWNVWGRWINWASAFILIQPGANANAAVAITSNAITPTLGNHTFSGAGTVYTIDQTNHNDGRYLTLIGTDSQSVTLKHLHGGTGQMQFANGQDLALTSSSSAVTLQRVGTKWVELCRSETFAASSGGRNQLILDTPGSGTWTCPVGVYSVEVEGIGSGAGGGGGGGDNYKGGGGGGAGTYKRGTFAVVPGTVYTYTVPAGGVGGTPTSGAGTAGDGGDGAPAIFDSFLSCAGGHKGLGGTGTNQGLGGAGGAGTAGMVAGIVTVPGDDGAGGAVSQAGAAGGGMTPDQAGVRAGFYAVGAAGVSAGATGNAATVPGGGGSGGGGEVGVTGGAGGAGGAGARGQLILRY